MQCAVATAGGWCGLCYVGRRGRETFKGHTGWRAPRDSTKRNEVMQFKRSAKADPMALKGLPSAQDASWAKHYPVLVEWMTATAWEDGAKRQPGSLLLIAEDGVWKAWVNDRDGQRSISSLRWTVGLLRTLFPGVRQRGRSGRVFFLASGVCGCYK